MPAPVLFGEANLEDDLLGESSSSCSYPPTATSAIHDLRGQDDEQADVAEPRQSIVLRAPTPSAALLALSGFRGVLTELDEPLRETREPFRLAMRDILPESTRVTERPSVPGSIEEALIRAARSSFASEPPRSQSQDRVSGVRMSDPHTIEEAVLRAVDAEQHAEQLAEQSELKIPGT
jgi:hypothetical protein